MLYPLSYGSGDPNLRDAGRRCTVARCRTVPPAPPATRPAPRACRRTTGRPGVSADGRAWSVTRPPFADVARVTNGFSVQLSPGSVCRYLLRASKSASARGCNDASYWSSHTVSPSTRSTRSIRRSESPVVSIRTRRGRLAYSPVRRGSVRARSHPIRRRRESGRSPTRTRSARWSKSALSPPVSGSNVRHDSRATR